MKCPGQDMQYWNSEAIFEVNCPKCGKHVEFYKDDTTRKCNHCGNRFVNPKMDFGCAAYCQFAEQCLGTLPEEFVGSQDNLLKDKVAVEMKRHFKSDFQRIGHTTRVARYAESIAKEEGANVPVILCAAYLHDLEDDNSAEKELVTAREILTKLHAKEAMAESVIALLQSQDQPSSNTSIELQLLQDAKHLATLEEQLKAPSTREGLDTDGITSHLKTTAASNTAKSIIEKYSA